MTQAEVAAAGGPSEPTVRNIEAGRQDRPTGLTLAALSRALRWPPGALEAIRDGADPATYDDGDATVRIAALAGELTPEQADKVEAYLRGLIDGGR